MLPLPAHATFANISALTVLGESTFTATGTNNPQNLGVTTPQGVVIDSTNSVVYVIDAGNNRILWWDGLSSLTTGQAASGVIGQTDFNGTSNGNAAANTLFTPYGLALDQNSGFWVADNNNSRVLHFTLPLSNGMSADIVLGQSNLTSRGNTTTQTGMNGPHGVAVSTTGAVWVTDASNNRVLEFAPPLSDGMNATLVLGQASFTTNVSGLTQTGMNFPNAIAVDTNGVVSVADQNNNRVLQFFPPYSNGMPAVDVLGEPNFTTNSSGVTASLFGSPQGLRADAAADLWVSDDRNNRVLEFVPPFSDDMPASLVVGATNFTSGGGGSSATHMSNPRGMDFDAAGNLYIADANNNRAVMFPSPIVNGASADLALGQVNLTNYYQNMIKGSGLNTPNGMAVDPVNNRIYVADTENSRVVWWDLSPAPVDGQSANGVFGAPDLFTEVIGNTASQISYPINVAVDPGGSLWVVDNSCKRVLRVPAPTANGASANLVIGQSNFSSCGSGLSQSQLNNPLGAGFDGSGNLWVADQGNNRVLRFPAASFGNGMNADIVLGQSNFASNTSGLSTTQLNGPISVAVDAAGNVWVADKNNNRILEFTPPLSNGMPASLVIGQANMTSGGTAVGPSGFHNPVGLAFDGSGDLWVGDQSNKRALLFRPPFSNGMNASGVLGQQNFTSNANSQNVTSVQNPYGIGVDASSNVWVLSGLIQRLLEFPGPPASAPAGLFGTALGISSIAWSWGAFAGATSYSVFTPTNAFVALASPLGTAFLQTGLSPNVAYGLQVAVNVADGEQGPLSIAATAYTLAATPGAFAATAVAPSSVGVSWTANGNPAGTQYQVEVATAADFGGASSQTVTVTTATFTGLPGATAYYLAVSAVNGNGIPSAPATLQVAPLVQAGVATIQSAVNAIPASLAQDYTIVVGGGVFPEHVTVQGVNTNGYRIYITADAGATPVVAPPTGSTAAFVIANASVTLSGLTIQPALALSYGIVIDSAADSLVQLLLQDGAGPITTAGVLVSGPSGTSLNVANSTIAVNVASVAAFYASNSSLNNVQASWLSNGADDGVNISGGNLNTLSQSTVTTRGAQNGVVYLNATASNTVTQSVLQDFTSPEAGLSVAGSVGNTISFSTIVTNGSDSGAVSVDDSSNTFSQVYALDQSGQALIINGGYGNSFSYCRFSGPDDAVDVFFGQNNSLTQSVITSIGSGDGVFLAGTGSNTLSFSTITTSNADDATVFVSESGDTIFSNYAADASSRQALLADGVQNEIISGNTFVSGSIAETFSNVSNLVFSGNNAGPLVLESGDGPGSFSSNTLSATAGQNAVDIQPGNTAYLNFASNTVTGGSFGFLLEAPAPGLAISTLTFQSLSPGATAMELLSGTVIATYTYVNFESANIAVNLDASGLNAASMVDLADSTGAFTGPAYLDDPSNVVSFSTLSALAAPSGFSGAGLGVSSISWAWNAVAGASAYAFYPSTGGAPVALSTTNFTQTGLSTNTVYSGQIAAVDDGVTWAPSAASSRYTLAAAPTSFALVSVTSFSVSASWAADTNPPSTPYALEASTAAGFSGASTTTVTASSASLTGLAAGTTYYLALFAKNGNGLFTPTGVILTTTTIAVPVGSISGLAGAAQGTSSITWTWSAAPEATGYSVYEASSPATRLGTPSSPSFTWSGLSTNTAYGIVVVGSNSGASGPLSAAVTAYTLAAPPTGFSLSAVNITSAAFSWSLNGDPASTQFQVTAAPSAGVSVIGTGTATSLTLNNLVGGTTYTVSIEALNGAAIPAPSTATLHLVTNPSLQAVAVLSSTRTTVVNFNPAQGPVVITVPAAAFSAAVQLTVDVPASYPPAVTPDATMTGTGVGVQLTLGQAGVQPQQPVLLSLSYAGSNLSQFNAQDLVIARFDPTDGVWVPLPSTSYPSQQLVTAYTNHFSLFQIMAVTAATSVSDVKVFPNPFRPALGESGMTFSNLPAGASIKIFTLLGQRVRELTADSSGIAVWDGTNGSGHHVASDVYFALLDGTGGKKVVKLIVQR